MRGSRGLSALAVFAAALAVVLSGTHRPQGEAAGAPQAGQQELLPAGPEAAVPAPRTVVGGAFKGRATAPGAAEAHPVPTQKPCAPSAPLEVTALAAPLGGNQMRITALLTPHYNETHELTIEFGLPEGVVPVPGQTLVRTCPSDPYAPLPVTLDVIAMPGLHQVVVHGWEQLGGRNNISAVATVDLVMP